MSAKDTSTNAAEAEESMNSPSQLSSRESMTRASTFKAVAISHFIAVNISKPRGDLESNRRVTGLGFGGATSSEKGGENTE